ncbi:OLC1v1008739C1 [Oldenlandia corymbosa var. corymbosa]|uniref:OLC1v1008739C1 n=1 Tax=Oldenlandia corymbosa var. corymbosa TaxID=529605 RepID=A0AAV1DM79_OLDCO|nr:OLC1v1008739C1 [Oldenlandia corymbosa var. corymbosa]
MVKTPQAKQDKQPSATVVSNSVWKLKEKLEELAKGVVLGNKSSSSRLTEKEKERISIDVEDKNTYVIRGSSLRRDWVGFHPFLYKNWNIQFCHVRAGVSSQLFESPGEYNLGCGPGGGS